MTAAPCTFREPAPVAVAYQSPAKTVWQVGEGAQARSVRVGPDGIRLCLTCGAHDAPAIPGLRPAGQPCAAVRAVDTWDRGQVGAGRAAA